MSLSSTMEIGTNGLRVFQAVNEVTSENIANVNTPGYSRQNAVLETAPSTTSNGFTLGTGVKIAAIDRVYDGLLQQQLVTASTTQGYDTAKSQVLQQIEPAFNETNQDGLGAAISKFFGSWQDLTSNPGGYFERQAVLSQSQTLADNFHSVSQTLNNSIATQDAALVPLTSSINASLKNIAQINQQILTTQAVSGNANEMRDQRDQMIRDLSPKIGIKFTENQDGTTDIYVQNGAIKDYLVQGVKYGNLTTEGTSPATSVYINGVSGAPVPVDPKTASPLYTAPDGGQLWATLQLRDTIIPNYLTQVDTLAKSITDKVNAVHMSGFSPTGTTGQKFFSTTSSAAGFSVDPTLTVDKIAASGNVALPSDNSNALAIVSLSSAQTMPPPPGTPSTTFNGFYNSFVSTVGLDVQSSKTTVAQDAAFSQQLSTLRESNSGVSLDEELTNLVKYQRSYQASAKLITTVTDMMDVTIGLIR